jgi:hypothetical protein
VCFAIIKFATPFLCGLDRYRNDQNWEQNGVDPKSVSQGKNSISLSHKKRRKEIIFKMSKNGK